MIEQHSISIFGKGAVGSALQDFFKNESYPIRSVWDSSGGEIYSVEDRSVIKSDNTFPTHENEIGDLVFIAVPDDQIISLTIRLSKIPIHWEKRSVIHCSGNLASDACASLRKKGSEIAAMHPIQTFKRGDGFNRFNEIYITLEGDEKLIELLQTFVVKMGAFPIQITADQKRKIHIASVIASNYLISLMHISETLLNDAGIKEGFNILQPLISQTVQNIFEKGVGESLTGPISRGDIESVKHHLVSLENQKNHNAIYKLLGLEALYIAEKSGNLNAELMIKLEKLLNQ